MSCIAGSTSGAADSTAAGDGAPAAAAAVEPDPVIVAQLMSMGFGENGCKRAAVATQVAAESPTVDADSVHQCGWNHDTECAWSMLLPANRQLVHPAVQNAGVETSMEWVFAHMEDADFNDPLPDPEAAAAATAASGRGAGGGGGGGGGSSKADPEAIGQLSAMGFTDVQASAALQVGGLHTFSNQLVNLTDCRCSQP